MIIFDANVLIALLYPDDAHNQWAVRICAQLEQEPFRMSALTMSECLVLPYRQGQGVEFEEALAELDIAAEPFREQDVSDLAILRAETRLRTPDAVVLLTALRGNYAIVTADKTLARVARERGLTAYAPE